MQILELLKVRWLCHRYNIVPTFCWRKLLLSSVLTLLTSILIFKSLAWIWFSWRSDRIINSEAANANYFTSFKYVPPEPIDLVYTWVNTTNVNLLKSMSKHGNKDHISRMRNVNNNQLLYSLRSIEKYAPWLRNIYIVTNGQIPHWLNIDNTKVTVVQHNDIFPPESIHHVQPTPTSIPIPTISNTSIEMFLHRIPNLSERFLYMNDNLFIGKPLTLDIMRSEHDGIYVMPSLKFPFCAYTCDFQYIDDGICQKGCYNEACNYDGDDCDKLIDTNDQFMENLNQKNSILDDDEYLRSLVHTHTVLTKRYGYKRRTTMAHTGFLINKETVEHMHKIFQDIVHRYEKDTLQFALIYYETLLNEKIHRTDDELFDMFDEDKSG